MFVTSNKLPLCGSDKPLTISCVARTLVNVVPHNVRSPCALVKLVPVSYIAIDHEVLIVQEKVRMAGRAGRELGLDRMGS